jgi:hypothetical protein
MQIRNPQQVSRRSPVVPRFAAQLAGPVGAQQNDLGPPRMLLGVSRLE